MIAYIRICLFIISLQLTVTDKGIDGWLLPILVEQTRKTKVLPWLITNFFFNALKLALTYILGFQSHVPIWTHWYLMG